jgi:methionyl-tRNA synthetase
MTTSPAPRKILIGVAWPYVNGLQHIGHIAGAHLPPDIFARFQRMIGNDVLMVSGSDTHGTPITIKADEEGKTPIEVVNHFHPRFIDSYLKLGLTYDLYTHTDTENHWAVTQNMFLRHKEKGYIYSEWQKQLFDPKDGRFLPDRYVIGTCPKCGFDSARGDQCDNCGAIYDALELKNPRSKIRQQAARDPRDGALLPGPRRKCQRPAAGVVEPRREGALAHAYRAYTKAQLEDCASLRGRPITRDLDVGHHDPASATTRTKRIYVWYDAVIGYLSAAKEWAKLSGDPEAWRQWWDADVNPDARSTTSSARTTSPSTPSSGRRC